MATGEVKAARGLRSEPAAALLLIGVATACAIALLRVERAVPPTELPCLTLSAHAVRASLAADRRAAAAAPDSTAALELDALLLEQGKAERLLGEPRERHEQRMQAFRDGYARVVAAHGERGAMALRARAVERVDAALDLELPAEQLEAVIGGLPRVLAREAMAIDGELVAPRFVVRAVSKARWNTLHGLASDHGFVAVERQAFYGWRALHAEGIAISQRLQALATYEKAGGADVPRARAALLFRADEAQAARDLLARIAKDDPSLRTRNHLLAARIVAERRR